MDHQASDRNYGLISKSESAGFIAVFPNGFSKLPSGKFAPWNAGICCADARDRRVDNVGLVRKILSNLASQLHVDRRRIYATGMSNRPIPIVHIHAQNDDRVLYDGGAGRKFGDPSQVTDFISVPVSIAKWVGQNGCKPQAQPTLTVAGAYCERYTPCQGRAEVQLCVTETGGHSWPGGYKALTGEPASQAISANVVMWAFFTSLATAPVSNH